MKLLFDCPKATLFIFNKRIHADFFEHLPADKQRYVFSVDYHDSFAIERTKVLAIASSSNELCKEVLFPSIMKIHKDAIRKREQLAICIRHHKKDGDLTCVLQIEFN